MKRIARQGLITGLLIAAGFFVSLEREAFAVPQDESAASQEQQGESKKKEGETAPAVPIQQGAQSKTPVAAKIEDIDAHRRKPIPFIRSLGDLVKLDLDKVDYDAPALAEVNGVPITQELFRDYLVLFLGGLEIDRFITALITQIGMEVRLAEGVDPKEFEVSEEQVDQVIESQLRVQQQMQKLPDIDIETFKKNIDATFGWERYRNLMRASVAFENVFLPDIKAKDKGKDQEGEEAEGSGEEDEDSGEEEGMDDEGLPVGTDAEGAEVKIYLPMITWNALSGREQDRAMRDMINANYAEGSGIDNFLRPHFTRSIKEAVMRNLDVEFFYTGNLEPGVFLRVEDRKLPLKEIYPVIAGSARLEDKMMALREALLMTAMDQVLEAEGSKLSLEEANEIFDAHRAEYDGTLFTLEFITRLNGYLSLYHYKNVYYRRAGFNKLFADELNNDEVLKNFYESAGRLLYENATVKIQLIFFGIYDPKTKTYRDDGYAWAEAQMAKALERLKDGEDFETLAKEYSDPEGTFTTWDFQLLNRQHLRMALGDTAKETLIGGFSLADYIYYSGKTGEVVGPNLKYTVFMGSPSHKGVYLARIQEYRRSQTLKPFDISRKMVLVDYGDLKFSYWAQEALKKADVTLTLKN